MQLTNSYITGAILTGGGHVSPDRPEYGQVKGSAYYQTTALTCDVVVSGGPCRKTVVKPKWGLSFADKRG